MNNKENFITKLKDVLAKNKASIYAASTCVTKEFECVIFEVGEHSSHNFYGDITPEDIEKHLKEHENIHVDPFLKGLKNFLEEYKAEIKPKCEGFLFKNFEIKVFGENVKDFDQKILFTQ